MFIRHGKVVSEGWWYPYRADINHIMYSVSKTVTSTAVGFAVSEKLLTVNDKVISFFPEDIPENVSPYLQELTVKDLLTMTVGNAKAPTFTRDDMNWVKSFLAIPIVNEPGTLFQYSTYATYMLSAIIQKVTGMTTFEYLTPRFFEPLGIENIQWETDPRGINTGGWGVRMKTMDMAKIGQFYLQKGKWKDKQLLPASWIQEATTPHIYQHPERSAEENATNQSAQGYGYQIWMCSDNAYRADGARGQFIIVIPDKDAVIITTAGESQMHTILKLIWENLLPMMFDYNLDSDEMTKEMLTSSLVSLKIPDPFYSKDSVDRLRNKQLAYRMEANKLGIEEIRFNFAENADCIFSIKTDRGTYDLPFGFDGWRYGETEKTGPYYLNLRRNPVGLSPFRVAGYYSMTEEDRMKFRLLYLTESEDETYDCLFTDNKLKLNITNSQQGEKEAVQLTGEPI